MSLKNLVIPEKTVSWEINKKRQEITVTGLDMEGIVILLQEDEEVFRSLFETEGLTLMGLLKASPLFCSKMIATAAGEPEEWKKVKRVPLGVQLRLLEAVWELTTVDMDDVGKVMGYLAEAIRALNIGLASEMLTAEPQDPADPQISS